VHAALWGTDQGVPGPQWCRTATADPDVLRTGGRTERVTASTYDAVMGIAPDGQRTGLLQVYYGWLGAAVGLAVRRDRRVVAVLPAAVLLAPARLSPA
jgi:hypothetical protein